MARRSGRIMTCLCCVWTSARLYVMCISTVLTLCAQESPPRVSTRKRSKGAFTKTTSGQWKRSKRACTKSVNYKEWDSPEFESVVRAFTKEDSNTDDDQKPSTSNGNDSNTRKLRSANKDVEVTKATRRMPITPTQAPRLTQLNEHRTPTRTPPQTPPRSRLTTPLSTPTKNVVRRSNNNQMEMWITRATGCHVQKSSCPSEINCRNKRLEHATECCGQLHALCTLNAHREEGA